MKSETLMINSERLNNSCEQFSSILLVKYKVKVLNVGQASEGEESKSKNRESKMP